MKRRRSLRTMIAGLVVVSLTGCAGYREPRSPCACDWAPVGAARAEVG